MVVDFRRSKPPLQPMFIEGVSVEVVRGYNDLDLTSRETGLDNKHWFPLHGQSIQMGIKLRISLLCGNSANNNTTVQPLKINVCWVSEDIMPYWNKWYHEIFNEWSYRSLSVKRWILWCILNVTGILLSFWEVEWLDVFSGVLWTFW